MKSALRSRLVKGKTDLLVCLLFFPPPYAGEQYARKSFQILERSIEELRQSIHKQQNGERESTDDPD